MMPQCQTGMTASLWVSEVGDSVCGHCCHSSYTHLLSPPGQLRSCSKTGWMDEPDLRVRTAHLVTSQRDLDTSVIFLVRRVRGISRVVCFCLDPPTTLWARYCRGPNIVESPGGQPSDTRRTEPKCPEHAHPTSVQVLML